MKSDKTHSFDMNSERRAAAGMIGKWCLPSGKALGVYALSGGFLAPQIWHVAGSSDGSLAASRRASLRQEARQNG